jgi:hypothetical protein
MKKVCKKDLETRGDLRTHECGIVMSFTHTLLLIGLPFRRRPAALLITSHSLLATEVCRRHCYARCYTGRAAGRAGG